MKLPVINAKYFEDIIYIYVEVFEFVCLLERSGCLTLLVPRVAYLLHELLGTTNIKTNVCFVFFPC
jgi:hypothetical protein